MTTADDPAAIPCPQWVIADTHLGYGPTLNYYRRRCAPICAYPALLPLCLEFLQARGGHPLPATASLFAVDVCLRDHRQVGLHFRTADQ